MCESKGEDWEVGKGVKVRGEDWGVGKKGNRRESGMEEGM